MRTKANKPLLLLMILALVIAPLRGAWAFAVPDSSASETVPHCAQMDMPAAGQPVQLADEVDHPCKSGCNGDCCDNICNTCVHSPVSLLNTVAISPAAPGPNLATSAAASFPQRTLIPPLRPPASQ